MHKPSSKWTRPDFKRGHRGSGMSALGQKRTFAVQTGMSALHPKADVCSALGDVRFVPIADISPPRWHVCQVLEATFTGSARRRQWREVLAVFAQRYVMLRHQRPRRPPKPGTATLKLCQSTVRDPPPATPRTSARKRSQPTPAKFSAQMFETSTFRSDRLSRSMRGDLILRLNDHSGYRFYPHQMILHRFHAGDVFGCYFQSLALAFIKDRTP